MEEDILNPTFSNNTVEHFSKTILLSILVNILERIQLCLSMDYDGIEYLNIVGHSQGAYQAIDGEICITNFNDINSSFCDTNFLTTKVGNLKKDEQHLPKILCHGIGSLKDNETSKRS